MEIKQVIEEVQQSEPYGSWEKDGYFLAHVFKMMDDANKNSWQVGYYNPESDEMVTFMKEEDSIEKVPPTEVLKSDVAIKELDLSEVQVDWEEALEKAAHLLQEQYSDQVPLKTFFILQTLESGVVYNLTYLSKSFNTINIRISAKDGSVIKHDKVSLSEMTRVEKGERESESSGEESEG